MAVVASATGAAVFGLSGVAAGLAGGALLGAGAGALYSGITGDGNILNSALTGGLLGATAGGIGAAFAPATAGLSAVPTAAGGASPALVAAQGATAATTPAKLNAIAAAQGVAAEGALTLPGLGLAAAPATITPSIMQGTGTLAGPAAMTGKQKLATGLGATAAMSLLGSQNQPTIQEQESNSFIRPFTYSQTRNPRFGEPGQSYFTQSYEAQQPVRAARGGIMSMANGGVAQPIVPMQQLAAPVNTYGGQRPVSQAVTDFNNLIAQRAQNEYNVQPAPLSTLPGGGQFASAPDVSKIINRYYQQNLGRAAEPEGLAFHTDQVTDRGVGLGQIAQNIRTSPEGMARQALMQPASAQAASPSQGGFTFDPVTRRFTAPSAPTVDTAQNDLFMGMDPNVLQQMYNQYQQQQNSFAGGKAGGLMPNNLRYANGGDVQGYNLGGYSDGGRLLRGPGDGVSDDIPAVIGDRQPARLADNEFVIPARIVSEIGNGSTDAGARRLYAMMDRVQNSRKKTIGKNKVAVNSKAYKELDKL